MTGHPPIEELEAIALGEGGGGDAAAHARQCAECARELAWLRAEAQLVRRRHTSRRTVGPAALHSSATSGSSSGG